MNKMLSKFVMYGLVAAGLALGVASPVLAHHSYAMFDRTKSVTIEGTVYQFQWTNPHVYVWVYVPNANAKDGRDLWAVEFIGGPNGLARKGWTKRTMQPGDKVKLDINPLRDGRTGGMFVRAYLADGKVMSPNGEEKPNPDGTYGRPDAPG